MLPPVTPFAEPLDVDDSLAAVEGRWRPVWQRLRKDRLALAGAAVVLAFIAMALAAPHLAPHDPNARFYNGISAQGAPLPPGTNGFLLGTDTNARDLLSRL